jgi:hypothetical protein
MDDLPDLGYSDDGQSLYWDKGLVYENPNTRLKLGSGLDILLKRNLLKNISDSWLRAKVGLDLNGIDVESKHRLFGGDLGLRYSREDGNNSYGLKYSRDF